MLRKFQGKARVIGLLAVSAVVMALVSGCSSESGGSTSTAIKETTDKGFEIYKKSTCVTCHGAELKGMGSMPKLVGIGDKLDQKGILEIIKNGSASKMMPAQYEENINRGLTEAEIDQLALWLSKQKTK